MITMAESEYATGGAVYQDGPLKVTQCKTCGSDIVWATSKRTNKKYPVNVTRGYMDQKYYQKNNFHDCKKVQERQQANRDYWAEEERKRGVADRNTEIMKQIQDLRKQGVPGNDPRISELLNSMET